MDKREVLKLLDLVNTVCASAPNDRRADPKDEKTVLAWTLLLEPYTYEQAKQGALAQMRKSRFFPAPAEIVANIPEEHTAKPDPEQNYWSPKMREQIEKMTSKFEEIKENLHAHGIPTLAEANAQGMNYKSWSALRKEKGI